MIKRCRLPKPQQDFNSSKMPMPANLHVLLAISASMLPLSLAVAAPSDPIASTAPASSCYGANGCPAWMPSQADMRSTIVDYFCELSDQGDIQPRVERVVRAESSPLTCSSLGEEPGSNFVCGGEMRFFGSGNDIDAITFSPTMRREKDGRFAIYEGDDEEGAEVWRVPASWLTSKTCASR